MANYVKAARLNPDNPDIYNNMGVIHKELREYNQAIEGFLGDLLEARLCQTLQ
ncbi:MAG: tetratricopeptide repeat protein [Nitrospinae bacterium]|nr:tetratricopeptide repeat protein [Nitrospinota bacterium]MZH15317.1 tetratricopeptide repeat protein [Nitrospinota bacterium]